MSKSKIKEKILTLLKKLPDDTSPEEMDDIMYHVYVKQQILRGLEDIKQGKVIPHKQVMENAEKQLEKWSK